MAGKVACSLCRKSFFFDIFDKKKNTLSHFFPHAMEHLLSGFSSACMAMVRNDIEAKRKTMDKMSPMRCAWMMAVVCGIEHANCTTPGDIEAIKRRRRREVKAQAAPSLIEDNTIHAITQAYLTIAMFSDRVS